MLTKVIESVKTLSFKAAKESDNYLTVSEGNKKLKPSKGVKYIIFNLPAIKTCPFATELCKKFCYALKAERCYPTAKSARAFNYIASMRAGFVEKMVFTIAANLNRPGYQKAKKVIVRIHESGDFYSAEYAAAWIKVARAFENDHRVVFMAYTKSVTFFESLEIPENMTVRYSLWSDTDPAEYAKAKALGLPVYTAVEKFTTESKKERCECINCTTCNKCWCKAIDMIKCEIH